ncbi:ribonuclease III [Pseudogemmobacter sonorensis]|uniref:ribonuclease III n=1 Tax=Pseudogemmobacter sonorensis TaxID=2989681 RepID=UPI0036A6455B
MRLSTDLQAFQTRIGHVFRRPDLLLRAVTHSSIGSATRPDNQRLEFLGDRVLGLSIAEALLASDRSATEGRISPRFNALVCQEACAEVAREIDLGAVLKLGRSEMLSGGRRKDAVLADAMEAVLAAVHLDAGFETARAMVLRLWGSRIALAEGLVHNPKSALQEWAQAHGLGLPVYAEVGRSGPDHAPLFTIEARLESGASARAEASGKKAAESAAAQILLKRLQEQTQ